MVTIFSEAARRDPYQVYDCLRTQAEVIRDAASGLWLALGYDAVKLVLSDSETFISRYGPDWMIFADPPRHTLLRALVSKAFTPRMIAALEPRIRQLSGELLDNVLERGEMDLVADFAAPLPMLVIAEMLGIPASNRPDLHRWADAILAMSYTIGGAPEAARAAQEQFAAATTEMSAYLPTLIDIGDREGLITLLSRTELDGVRLTHAELLGFFQLLLLAGSETTTNLITNAVISLVEHPDQLKRLRANRDCLPSAIEEVLRYRSPLQWMYRITRRDVDLLGHSVPAGAMVLAVIGAANRDPAAFTNPDRFDIARDPNPHLAFGYGPHFCLGAPLARLEARIALQNLLDRVDEIELGSWEPRPGAHVLGPSRLPFRFTKAQR